MTASTGVTVGKFNPPHLGHRHLIEVSAAQVEHLYVLLCERTDQTLPAELRRRWLEDAAPTNVTVVVTPDDLPEENEPWAARTLDVLPVKPDLAFTSESYGDGWAELMGAMHVPVDLERATYPFSATEIRLELGAHFHYLVPAARADLSRRVVLIGAESTGKSTLAEALALELGTTWVPEHGRWYWEGRRHLGNQHWDSDEFYRIAMAQRSLEDDLARLAINGVVIADTDGLVTAVWHERYLDRAGPSFITPSPDLYLICSPDFAWEQDGTRESEQERQWMHERMVELANKSGAAVQVLSGPHVERLVHALELVHPLTQFPPLV